MYTCKNCGRKFSYGGTALGSFCCKGCKLEYEQKKRASKENSRGSWKVAIILGIATLIFIIIKANT